MSSYHITAIGDYEFLLVLNPMQSNTESGTRFGPYQTRESLAQFYNGELVEPYSDPGTSLFDGRPTTWRKTFRKGGPLEWYNPCNLDQPCEHFGHGVHEVLVNVRSVMKMSPAN